MSVIHKQQPIPLLLILLLAFFSPTAAQPQERPLGVWATSYGPMDFSPANARYFATFEEGDYPGGRLIGQLSGRVFEGIWVENADVYCKEPRDGNKYWGRVRFEFNENFTAFEGKWSYCDADPGSTWDGDEPVAKGET